MRRPTKHAVGLKPLAIIYKSWDKDQGGQLVEGHFEWFETTKAQRNHFDQMTSWDDQNVADQDNMLYMTVEVLDTRTMRLGRSHIAPADDGHLRIAVRTAQADPCSLLAEPVSSNPATNDLVDFLGRLGGEGFEVVDYQTVDFFMGDVTCSAYLKDGGSRVRGSAFLDLDVEAAEAQAWVAKQPQPKSARLQVLENSDKAYGLRLLFERSVEDDELEKDPLCDEIVVYADAWRTRADTDLVNRPDFVTTGDPRDVAPANAWLLLGDDASWLESDVLEADTVLAQAGIFESLWTTSKRTAAGDLVLIYFIAPRKAVHFVARSASRAFFDRSLEVGALKDVAKEQWWCYLTPPIEIEPIPFVTLQHLAGGDLPLHGKSGVYLTPELIAALPARAKNASDDDALRRVLRPPVGRADLPAAEEVTVDVWPTIASGALPLEIQVEQYLVEPLLRLTVGGQNGMAWTKRMKVGAKVTDYTVTRDASPVCVIEVKVAVREAPNLQWTSSKDFQQARGYADAIGCRSALIDTNRVYLIDKGADQPRRIFERRNCTPEDLKVIGAHLRGDAS